MIKKTALLAVLASSFAFGASAATTYVALKADSDSGYSTKDSVTSDVTPTFTFKGRRDSAFSYELLNKTTGESTSDRLNLSRFVSKKSKTFPYLADGKYELKYTNTDERETKYTYFEIDTTVAPTKLTHRVSGDSIIFSGNVEPNSLVEISYYPQNKQYQEVATVVTSNSDDGYVVADLPLISSEEGYVLQYFVTDKAGNRSTTTNFYLNF
ncbi:Ig-like domain-containing protein [Vibrio owensii]|uniref:Ig-like domain-containing protein n=1 Tax=Vibrio harveyi group TaxID=717610 RepID=UPI003CC5D75C